MTRFSAPINPERPRGAPSCAKCGSLVTAGGRATCGLGEDTSRGSCARFADASVERTERRGLKQGYDVVRVA